MINALNEPDLYRFFCLSLYRNSYYNVRLRIEDIAKITGEKKGVLKNFNKSMDTILTRKKYPSPINHPVYEFTMRSLYKIPAMDYKGFITLSHKFTQVKLSVKVKGYYIKLLLIAENNTIPLTNIEIANKLGISKNTVFKYNHHFQLFSKFTADYFRKKYPTKSMFYAPMAVKSFGEVVTDNYKVDSSKLNLLFFGNVVENKRLDLLIDAIKGLPQEIQNRIHLNICGNCKDAERFIRQIDGCSSISTYFKRIDDCEIAELFTKHDFLMLPYEDVAQSGPHMIAYYYNLPVIASDIEGFAERVIDGENGYLFKRNNLHDLVAVIKKASQLDNVEYVKMRNNLRTYTFQNYSVETVASKYIEYFKSL